MKIISKIFIIFIVNLFLGCEEQHQPLVPPPNGAYGHKFGEVASSNAKYIAINSGDFICPTCMDYSFKLNMKGYYLDGAYFGFYDAKHKYISPFLVVEENIDEEKDPYIYKVKYIYTPKTKRLFQVRVYLRKDYTDRNYEFVTLSLQKKYKIGSDYKVENPGNKCYIFQEWENVIIAYCSSCLDIGEYKRNGCYIYHNQSIAEEAKEEIKAIKKAYDATPEGQKLIKEQLQKEEKELNQKKELIEKI